MLFADIVGFTPLAEARDHEAVRELLSGYFDVARTVITRHGGRVEKFIGDAVMAVWGAPVARENDAELAVRAGLELVSAVTGYGQGIQVPDLAVRAGIVTGEVTVSLGADAEGMVAGDAVNTAARIQSIASSGTVLTDETSFHLTRAAIGFTPAGSHRLKGKAESVALYQALRATAGAGGQDRVDALEAGFIGRDAELRLLKEQFHACADRRAARLLVLTGEAGIGKTRLRWEFEKYADGLPSSMLWHTGKCLSYGDGVAFWALAQMVRQRFGIADTDPNDVSEIKFSQGMDRWLPHEEDRALSGPQLRVLLGLSQQPFLRGELYVGWRLFLQRLADQEPVVMVIEDGQYADPGLLDFIDHLLDWAAASPIMAIFLTRPELSERRPGWGTGRHAMTVRLEPLVAADMAILLDDLVTNLPQVTRQQIVGSAGGVPMYAVETIRSLIARDAVGQIDGRFRVIQDIGRIQTPPSLVALLSSRIDALPDAERSLVRDLAVLGSSFPRTAIAAVNDLSDSQLDHLMQSLMRKEILRIQADRLSPQHGEYAFTQELLRTVAYQTLARRDRRSRHLAVAAHLRSVFPNDGEEIAEVVAAHLNDAYQAAIDDNDSDELRRQAMMAYQRAGQRALSIGAPETAATHLSTAAELASTESERAELLGAAGEAAFVAGGHVRTVDLLEQAIALHQQAGRIREAARLTVPMARAAGRRGRTNFAIERLRNAIAALDEDQCSEMADLKVALAAEYIVLGTDLQEAESLVEAALIQAQALELPDILARAMDFMAGLKIQQRRPAEGLALLEKAVTVAKSGTNLRELAMRHVNAGYFWTVSDEPGAREHLVAALTLARQLGSRDMEGGAVENLMAVYNLTGEWQHAQDLARDIVEDADRPDREYVLQQVGYIAALQHQHDVLEKIIQDMAAWRSSDNPEDQARVRCLDAYKLLLDGEAAGALIVADESITSALRILDLRGEVRDFYHVALDAAFAIPSRPDIIRLLALVGDRPRGHVPPFLQAQHARFTARWDAMQGQLEDADAGFAAAEQIFERLQYPYWLALTRLEHAEHLATSGQPGPADELAALTIPVFERLEIPALTIRAGRVQLSEGEAGGLSLASEQDAARLSS